MLAEFNEISPAKINLFLKIIGKRDDGYHNLRSGVTLINLHDEVSAQKSSEFKVKYTGEFAPPDNIFKDCIVEKIFSKFKIVKPQYCFTIKKNIPVQSGLGSASSNAAAIIRILKKLDYKEIKTINFSKIGADVPLFLENQDSLVRGIGDITVKQLFPKYYFLLIKPIQNCSTQEMYHEVTADKIKFDLNFDTDEISEFDMGNDFEVIADRKYPEISTLLKFMRGFSDVIFSRLTGSGSCIYSAFEKKNSAEKALMIFKERFPDLWSVVVENNFINIKQK
jgi:4-diphosphocytidyl-2-C-methyl-D-erythritol kinase